MHFVIAGRVNCPEFVYATMIAQRLKESLPEFTYLRISKKPRDWENWLIKTCQENEWYHIKSPIIWREISMTKGKKHYIGDVTKFLDLCQDYYGLSRKILTGESFDHIEMEWFTHRMQSEYFEDVREKARQHLGYRCRKVCILGAACYSSDVLIMELLHIPAQNRENGMEIRLYDEHSREQKLAGIAADAKHCLGYSGLGSCRVAANLKDALYQVDLVIVLDSFPRKLNESIVKWLKRNRNAMCALGLALNKYARKHCRVILGGPSNQPLCYNATVLASFATKLHVRNIVAVTQDLGRETLMHISKKKSMLLKDLYCPPVWGFIGLNKCIDLKRTLQNFYYKVPGHRLSRRLPQGTEELEIRTIEPLLTDEEIDNVFKAVDKHKVESMPRLGRVSQLAKITAILDLLKVWGLQQEDGNGEIISLGVYSDGTFNIPEGLYWSQPVTLEKGFWRPFPKYPIPKNVNVNIQSFFLTSLASLLQTKVKIRKQPDPKPVRKRKHEKRFDVNAIKEAVNMSMVRTKMECVTWLKHLARTELDIEIDKAFSQSAIAEVSEISTIESVPPQMLYCECWRRQLLQLRQIPPDKSSTTEVEVDLSENLSESEWSIIGPSGLYTPPEETPSAKAVMSRPTENSSQISSRSTVCSCEGTCQCLEVSGGHSTPKDGKDEENFEPKDETLSWDETEEMTKKEFRFDPTLGPCAGRGKTKYKLYGTKDAIADDEKVAAMRRRIEKYERGGDGEDEDAVSDGSVPMEYMSQRFHVSLDDGLEIIGDPDGLEALEEIKRSGMKGSAGDFTEMWADEVTPALQVLSSDSDSQSTSVDGSTPGTQRRKEPYDGSSVDELQMYGEDGYEIILEGDQPFYKSQLEVIPEDEEGEVEVEPPPREGPPQPEEKVEEKIPSAILQLKKRKWEGVPRCCLCHCIVPEGELGCHCGERRVMEVFKKDSMEAIQESEGEWFVREGELDADATNGGRTSKSTLTTAQSSGEEDRRKSQEGEESESGESEDASGTRPGMDPMRKMKERDIFSLPPESFFPFSPKPVNKFTITTRPPEMEGITAESAEEESMHDTCEKMVIEVGRHAMNEMDGEDAEDSFYNRRKQSLAVEDELRYELNENRDIFDKTIRNSFYPVENWKTKLLDRYKEWFKVGDAQDDMYYEMAVAEVSEDESEEDKELRQYFED